MSSIHRSQRYVSVICLALLIAADANTGVVAREQLPRSKAYVEDLRKEFLRAGLEIQLLKDSLEQLVDGKSTVQGVIEDVALRCDKLDQLSSSEDRGYELRRATEVRDKLNKACRYCAKKGFDQMDEKIAVAWLLLARTQMRFHRSVPAVGALVPLADDHCQVLMRLQNSVKQDTCQSYVEAMRLRDWLTGRLDNGSGDFREARHAGSSYVLELGRITAAVSDNWQKQEKKSAFLNNWAEWMNRQEKPFVKSPRQVLQKWKNTRMASARGRTDLKTDDNLNSAIDGVEALVPWPLQLAEKLKLGRLHYGYETLGFDLGDGADAANLAVVPRIRIRVEFESNEPGEARTTRPGQIKFLAARPTSVNRVGRSGPDQDWATRSAEGIPVIRFERRLRGDPIKLNKEALKNELVQQSSGATETDLGEIWLIKLAGGLQDTSAVHGLIGNYWKRKISSHAARITDGHIASWSADGNTLDSIGGATGELKNGATFAPSLFGQAFNFTANTHGVALSNRPGLQIQNFTIEACVKRADSSKVTVDTGAKGAVFSYGTKGYGFGLVNDGRLYLNKVDGPEIGSGSLLVTDTQWHNIAVTINNGNVFFFVDGVASQPSPQTPIPTYEFGTNPAIGARGDNLNATFLGAIDEVNIYDRALSQSEIHNNIEASLHRPLAGPVSGCTEVSRIWFREVSPLFTLLSAPMCVNCQRIVDRQIFDAAPALAMLVNKSNVEMRKLQNDIHSRMNFEKASRHSTALRQQFSKLGLNSPDLPSPEDVLGIEEEKRLYSWQIYFRTMLPEQPPEFSTVLHPWPGEYRRYPKVDWTEETAWMAKVRRTLENEFDRRLTSQEGSPRWYKIACEEFQQLESLVDPWLFRKNHKDEPVAGIGPWQHASDVFLITEQPTVDASVAKVIQAAARVIDLCSAALERLHYATWQYRYMAAEVAWLANVHNTMAKCDDTLRPYLNIPATAQLPNPAQADSPPAVVAAMKDELAEVTTRWRLAGGGLKRELEAIKLSLERSEKELNEKIASFPLGSHERATLDQTKSRLNELLKKIHSLCGLVEKYSNPEMSSETQASLRAAASGLKRGPGKIYAFSSYSIRAWNLSHRYIARLRQMTSTLSVEEADRIERHYHRFYENCPDAALDQQEPADQMVIAFKNRFDELNAKYPDKLQRNPKNGFALSLEALTGIREWPQKEQMEGAKAPLEESINGPRR